MNVKASKKKTIVFVEDDPTVFMAYRNLLEQEGFHIEPAQDGLEGMKILGRLVPDLVVLDLFLPKFSGVDVLKFIHSNSRLQNVPVVILSTSSIADAADEYLLERAHKRLLKDSCTPAIMLQTVQELLARHAIPSDPLPANPADDSQSVKNKTVVFIEDNPVVLAAYRNRLEQGGFRVEPARDGLEAMKLLSRLVPDAVVLDLLLPKFNGVDVLKFISSTPRLSPVCVIIFSTISVIAATEEYVLERANKRLIKDACTPAIMFQTIRELLASSSGQTGASSASPPGVSQTDEPKADAAFAGLRSAA
jgi:CheY-like chemotaxis protein